MITCDFLSPSWCRPAGKMISLGGYLTQVQNAWDDYDGDALAQLISFEDPHIMNPKLQVGGLFPNVFK